VSHPAAGIVVAVATLGLIGPVSAESASSLHRDPFEAPSPAEQPVRAAGVLVRAAPWRAHLRATLTTGRAGIANVNGRMLAIGERLDGYRLIAIGERSATFEHDGRRYRLALEDDQDGEVPATGR
jgi:hypothetical protein